MTRIRDYTNMIEFKLLRFGCAAALALALIACPASAATLSGGALTLNLDRNAMIAGVGLNTYPALPSIYLEHFWDASSNNLTMTQLLENDTPADLFNAAANEIPATGLVFDVNGPGPVDNPTQRQNQATTFSFDGVDLLGTASGEIGLSGVMRFRVDVTPPHNRVLSGDFDLEYDPTLENAATGQSGWVIMNNVGFRIINFDLFNVTTMLTGNSLNVSGTLALGAGFDHLSGIRDTRVGTFSFQSAVVPLPGAWALFGSGVIGLWRAVGKKRAAVMGA